MAIILSGGFGVVGADGADGRTVLNGTSVPSSGLGVSGDFYINTVTDEIYGPKSVSVWGSPTDLIGPNGIATIDYQGAFVSATAYVPGNFVVHSAQTYIATLSSTNSEPPSSAWDSFPFVGGTLTVEEVDTVPSVLTVTKIVVPNGSLTNDGGGQVTIAFADPKTSLYPTFSPGANDDEFDDSSFTGWTAVNTGTQVPTVTETNDVASVLHPGGGTAAYLWAYMKSYAVQTNDYIEIAFRFGGTNQNYNRAGLIMADGTTFGAGAQTIFCASYVQNDLVLTHYTGYDTDVAGTTPVETLATLGAGVTFLRLKYEGSNSWRGYVSPDGISWADVTGTVSSTVTPTKIGFFLTPYGGAAPIVMSLHYFKQSA